mmetsp:Transcript_73634/g.203265  ORF Transcript_73634/g.203265 Transcript_73634/m.203265 type:complete len:217 (-) Transcript_73634:1900-2550(-)
MPPEAGVRQGYIGTLLARKARQASAIDQDVRGVVAPLACSAAVWPVARAPAGHLRGARVLGVGSSPSVAAGLPRAAGHSQLVTALVPVEAVHDDIVALARVEVRAQNGLQTTGAAVVARRDLVLQAHCVDVQVGVEVGATGGEGVSASTVWTERVHSVARRVANRARAPTGGAPHESAARERRGSRGRGGRGRARRARPCQGRGHRCVLAEGGPRE